MHPLIRLYSLLVFVVLLALGGFATLLWGGLLLLLAYGLAARRAIPGLAAGLRRIRWLLLSILVLYGWWTPGPPLWEGLGALSPSRSGLALGGVRIGLLVAIVAAVHWVLRSMERTDLLAALVALTAPLARLGLNHQRFAVRVVLTLDAVPRVQAEVGHVLAQPLDAPIATRWAYYAQRLYARVLDRAQAQGCQSHEWTELGPVPLRQWSIPIVLGLVLVGARWPLWP